MSTRKFKIIHAEKMNVKSSNVSTKKIHTIFTARSPVNAALKAFNALCSANSHTKTCKYKISIQDVTKNGKMQDKEYHYKAERVFNPRVIILNGKAIQFNYEAKAHAYNKKKESKCIMRCIRK